MAIDRNRINKKAFSIAPLSAPSDEKTYWLSKSPYERLEAVELQRQIIISLKHLKINKQASGRYKDLNDLEHLP